MQLLYQLKYIILLITKLKLFSHFRFIILLYTFLNLISLKLSTSYKFITNTHIRVYCLTSDVYYLVHIIL